MSFAPSAPYRNPNQTTEEANAANHARILQEYAAQQQAAAAKAAAAKAAAAKAAVQKKARKAILSTNGGYRRKTRRKSRKGGRLAASRARRKRSYSRHTRKSKCSGKASARCRKTKGCKMTRGKRKHCRKSRNKHVRHHRKH